MSVLSLNGRDARLVDQVQLSPEPFSITGKRCLKGQLVTCAEDIVVENPTSDAYMLGATVEVRKIGASLGSNPRPIKRVEFVRPHYSDMEFSVGGRLYQTVAIVDNVKGLDDLNPKCGGAAAVPNGEIDDISLRIVLGTVEKQICPKLGFRRQSLQPQRLRCHHDCGQSKYRGETSANCAEPPLYGATFALAPICEAEVGNDPKHARSERNRAKYPDSHLAPVCSPFPVFAHGRRPRCSNANTIDLNRARGA